MANIGPLGQFGRLAFGKKLPLCHHISVVADREGEMHVLLDQQYRDAGLFQLVMETGGWKGAFIIAALFNVIAALLAIFVLKPMRQRLVTRPDGRAAWVAGARPT